MSAQKPKVQFSIRVPAEIIKLLDEIAENTGLNITRNNVVEQACEWYVLTYRANGNRAMTKDDFEDLRQYITNRTQPMQTPDTVGFELPEDGYSPVRTQKQRKSQAK